MPFATLVDRDKTNAEIAQGLAIAQIATIPMGVTGQSIANFSNSRRKSLDAIRHKPFDVMIEGEFENRDGKVHPFLWYGNERVQIGRAHV